MNCRNKEIEMSELNIIAKFRMFSKGLFSNGNERSAEKLLKLIDELESARTSQSEWISVADIKYLELPFESEEDPNEDGYPQFYGMVSQTVEITDGEARSFGHYRSDGEWNVYIIDHDLDFLNVNPNKITHYKVLDKLPQ
jgi:hypothetical protein